MSKLTSSYTTISAIILLFLLFVGFPSPGAANDSTHQWIESHVRYRTLEKEQVVLSTTVIWRIADYERFDRTANNVKTANSRIADIIAPAVKTVVISKYKNDLFGDRVREGGKHLRKEHTDKINTLSRDVLAQFGIEITEVLIVGE